MRCPLDGETLVMTERSGVEIDYCPRCRGVWLDRGELDKIIDRAAGTVNSATPSHLAPAASQPQRHDMRKREYERKRKEKPYYRKSKKHSFLKELFDFD